MHCNDNDSTIFGMVTGAGPVRLVMTTMATRKSTSTMKMPLWWYQPKSATELTAICVWLGEQRASWPAWRKIAEDDGINAVNAEIVRAWSQSPLESCNAVMLNQGDDPREITMFAMLVTRNSEVVRHRFTSAARRKAFLEWYFGDAEAISSFLLFEGCLVGPEHLAGILDRRAEIEVAKRKSGKRGQRKSAGMRNAA